MKEDFESAFNAIGKAIESLILLALSIVIGILQGLTAMVVFVYNWIKGGSYKWAVPGNIGEKDEYERISNARAAGE